MKEEKQISFKRHVIILVVTVLIVALVSTVASYQIISRKRREAILNEIGGDLGEVAMTYQKIMSQYVGKVSPKELSEGAIKGMTNALDDPYTEYYSGAEKQSLDDTISGSFEGIGAVMTIKDGVPMIAEPPIADTPAEKKQLRANDLILKIDGKETKDEELTDVVKKIRGKKGTDVTLTIQRDADVFDVILTRDKIPVESVFAHIDSEQPTVGYIQVTTFSENTAADFEKALVDLKKQGANSYIIDMRKNPGGLLTAVLSMASMFVEDGQTILQIENKNGEKEEIKADKKLDNGHKVKEPVVVLVDEQSASASEIFAAAIKEAAKMPVIGTKTFGKGTMQSIQPITDESELKLTTNKWLTPKGNWIHKKGLKPTIESRYPFYAYLNPMDKENSYQFGAEGKQVLLLNGMLAGLDYEVSQESEVFDAATQEAVTRFQEDHDLSVTGIANRDTINAIEMAVIQKLKDNDPQYDKAIETLLSSSEKGE